MVIAVESHGEVWWGIIVGYTSLGLKEMQLVDHEDSFTL